MATSSACSAPEGVGQEDGKELAITGAGRD